MHIQSPYPNPPSIPSNEPINAFNVLFNRPIQKQWEDFTLHIDAVTGKELKYSAFKNRLQDAITALGAPVESGGLGLGGAPEITEDGSLSTEAREVVGIMSENSSDYIILMNALLATATPYALIAFYATRFELLHALKLSRATRLFVQAKLLPLALPVAKEAGLSPDHIYLLDNGQGPRTLSEMIADVRRRKIPRQDVCLVRKDTLAYLIFSSGTTGLPKAAMMTHGNIYASIIQLSAMETSLVNPPPPPASLPVTLAFLPMHHAYGLAAYCQRAFITRATWVIMGRWNPVKAVQLIRRYGVTLLPLVPSMMHQLINLDYPNLKEAMESVSSVVAGAAYASDVLQNKFKERVSDKLVFTVGFGMTELVCAATQQPTPGLRLKPDSRPLPDTKGEGSVGILTAGIQGRILREDGSDAEVDEPGELYLRGPSTCAGYWDNPTANAETFVKMKDSEAEEGRWLRTGDMFKANKDGVLFYADRKKDIFKISGSQVSPMEIENVLLAHPSKLVSDVAVAGVTVQGVEEKVPRAWVVLSQAGNQLGSKQALEELDRWHKEALSRYKWLRGGIKVIDELPKSETGKTLRRALVEEYERNVRIKGKL
ncbi:4-coumarate- ligase [Moniliophthora roreri MCA 2997]|uniref:4-coumarate-ligase n=1 Tax=Moniliophthora roreri (strain MCA 2997) TaxID=1381753 RepID=V2WU32_MONRO|nr:4-coumarate- ligase [Moniliophthora roreri MCA 2997]KAI3615123.1 4-coumarate-ligase [Moniliophthora roreri]